MKRKEEQFHALILGAGTDDVRAIEEMLAEAQRGVFKVTHVPNITQAQPHLSKEKIDFIFVDLDNALRESNNIFGEIALMSATWPVLVLIDGTDDDVAWQSMHRGAQDFLVKKQFDSALLLRTIRHSLVRHKLIRKLNDVMQENEKRDNRSMPTRSESYENADGFRALMSKLPGLVWTVDKSLKVTSSLGGSWSRFDLKPEQVVGQDLLQLFGADNDRHPLVSGHRKALEGVSQRYDFDWDGFSFESVSEPIRDERGEIIGVASVAFDITERKILEGQFQASQKLESIGRLAGGIAHDFNNLLTVIINYTQLILNQTQDEATKTRLGAIANCAQRAASLTGQLLAFGRQQVLKAQNIDLNVVLSSIDQMLNRIIGEDIELLVVRDPKVGKISADPNQVLHIVMNLAVNARDAMPEGGKLTIETKNVELDGKYAQKHAEVAPGQYVMLAISDSGAGMDQETQDRIFEPFFTTKEFGKGAGLGLSVIHGVVKQSGGHIWVYSELEHGTTFKIYFPRADAQAVSMPKVKKEEAKTQGGSETILVVEDEDVVRQVACDIIRGQGYRVLEATNAISALEMCERGKEHVDLILTDLVMPKMNGPELVKRLTSKLPKLSVIFMSGYTNDAANQNGNLPATSAFVQKPFMPKTLLQAIRNVLDAR